MVLGLAHRNVGRVARTNFFKVMFRMRYSAPHVKTSESFAAPLPLETLYTGYFRRNRDGRSSNLRLQQRLEIIRAFFGSIPEDFGNRGESTITKLPTRNKRWQKDHKKDQTTANRMTVFFFFLRSRNPGMATGILRREFSFETKW